MSALRFELQEHSSRAVPAEPPLPPGPRSPRAIQTLRLAFRPLQTVEACARRWGDWFTLRLIGGRTQVFCSHPDAIRDLHTGDPETLRAGEAAEEILAPLLGKHSLLVLDGERHLRERRLMSPPFGERVHVYGRLVCESVRRVLDRWPRERPFQIHHEMQP